MLDGMQNLQQLNLRNNSLNVLENLTFTSVSQITTLDLAHNGIHTIEKDVFRPLKDVFWLDLSSNLIKTIEKDTFKEKIANILLNGMFKIKIQLFKLKSKFVILFKLEIFSLHLKKCFPIFFSKNWNFKTIHFTVMRNWIGW